MLEIGGSTVIFWGVRKFPGKAGISGSYTGKGRWGEARRSVGEVVQVRDR